MKNKFALSFGISLIIVGLLNIFFDTNGIIIFGLSLSALVFSMLNIFTYSTNNDKKAYIYIIPFVILLSIFCYSSSLAEYKIVQAIVNGKFLNVLTFISFGLLFISEYLNYRHEITADKIRNMSTIVESYDYSILILKQITDYYKTLTKNEIILDDESHEFLESIEKICKEKINRCNVESELLKLDKDYYSLDDIDSVYVKNNDILGQVSKDIKKEMEKNLKRELKKKEKEPKK